MRLLILWLCFIPFFSGCYVLEQAMHQNALMNSRRPIDEVVTDPSVDDKVKEKLRFSKKVVLFAKKQGLNTSGSYEHYVHINEEAISYLVSAAEVDRLQPVTWWFPVVGSVPYLGFFEKGDRDAEAISLKEAGYDVMSGQVGAYSTLGWFEDPIYTPMLNRSKGRLAHLLFHELTHRTYWSIGSTQFNENLAEFVADKLTTEYLELFHDAQELKIYHVIARENKKYKAWLKSLRASLEQVYESGLDREAMLLEKSKTFNTYKTSKFPNFESKGYQNIKNREWNNARVVSSSLYSPDTARFEKAFDCIDAPSVGEFLRVLQDAEDDFDDAYTALDSLCVPVMRE